MSRLRYHALVYKAINCSWYEALVLQALTKSPEVQVLVTSNTADSCLPASILVVPDRTNEVKQFVIDTEEILYRSIIDFLPKITL